MKEAFVGAIINHMEEAFVGTIINLREYQQKMR